MKIFQYNSPSRVDCEYNINAADLYDKFKIALIYLAYHNAENLSTTPLVQSLSISGYYIDSMSFYYFILETSADKEDMRLTFNLPMDSWELSGVQANDLSEKLNKLEKQQAINMMEFIDLFGM